MYERGRAYDVSAERMFAEQAFGEIQFPQVVRQGIARLIRFLQQHLPDAAENQREIAPCARILRLGAREALEQRAPVF